MPLLKLHSIYFVMTNMFGWKHHSNIQHVLLLINTWIVFLRRRRELLQKKRGNKWINWTFGCLFAIFCLLWYWVMWWHTLQKCMLIVGARSMGLTYFLWFSSWTATAAHVKQPNVFHSFWLGKKKQNNNKKKHACFDVYFLSQHFQEVFYNRIFLQSKNIYIYFR